MSARSRERARATAQELATAGTIQALDADLDVADDASVASAAATIAQHPGRLDVLINNAAAFVDWSETAAGANLATAADILLGAWRTTAALLPLLHQSAHPRVVFVSMGCNPS